MKFVDQIAQTCHEVNRAYCQTLGDQSQVEWLDTPDWMKESILSGIEFCLDHPNLKPSHLHANWMSEKSQNGWKYGDVKDPDKKEHPRMVPYDKLPKEQQAKDALFIAVVKSFL